MEQKSIELGELPITTELPKQDRSLPSKLQLASLQKISSGMIKLGDPLGEGGYGMVYQGKWQGIDVAVKQLRLQMLSGSLSNDFEREADIMAHCQHPHVVRLYGVCLEPNHYSMVIEYLPKGSLYHVLSNPAEELPWNPIRWQMAIDIGKGLAYLHSQNVIHCDLKSLNVLVDNLYYVKISDFGLSKIKLESRSRSIGPKSNKVMGTTRWRAPELFPKPKIKASPPNKVSDVYSYGMILWEIASRELPYKDVEDEMVGYSIGAEEKENIPVDCPADYAQVVQTCWEVPDKRLTAEKAVAMLEQAKPQALAVDVKEKRQALKETPYTAKSWYFDEMVEYHPQSDGTVYQLISASENDFKKAVAFYEPYPVSGYEVQSVKVIYNPSMNQEFSLYMQRLQERNKNPAFAPYWSKEDYKVENRIQREKVQRLFESMTAPYTDFDVPAVKLLPLWHGTSPDITDSIFRTGYANLATTDPGFFGKGLYSTAEAEYASRVYSKGALILNWVAIFSAYPVILTDQPKLEGKGNYANYDAHFVPVVPRHNRLNETAYDACKPRQKQKYIEVVVFQSAAMLPRYLVTLEKSLKPSLPQTAETLYQQGRILVKARKYKEALSCFEAAAKENYPPAYLWLEFLYRLGLLKQDKDERAYYTQKAADAIGWFKTEAEKGSAEAQNNLGLCYSQKIGVKKDLHRAFTCYLQAANQGLAAAQNNVALCYDSGEGTIQDFLKAAAYYQRAADQGYSFAQRKLGVYYKKGIAGEQSVDKAFHYFELAANQGDSVAQYYMGRCYEKGAGVAMDYLQAANYYEWAEEQDNKCAQRHLGYYYQNGTAGQQDKEKAFYYFKLAADQGDAKAQYQVGQCYQKGEGVNAEVSQAIDYFELAAKQKHSEAASQLAVLKKVEGMGGQLSFFGEATKSQDKKLPKEKNQVLESQMCLLQ